MTEMEKLDLLLSEMMSLKNNMANTATKDDIANMASKDDIANMASKDDIAQIITATKDELYNEIIRAEKQTEKIENRFDNLSDKVDTLLLKADNTALLLKLINQQADEMSTLKARLEIVEKKLA